MGSDGCGHLPFFMQIKLESFVVDCGKDVDDALVVDDVVVVAEVVSDIAGGIVVDMIGDVATIVVDTFATSTIGLTPLHGYNPLFKQIILSSHLKLSVSNVTKFPSKFSSAQSR